MKLLKPFVVFSQILFDLTESLLFIWYLMSWHLLLGTITSSDARRRVKVGQSEDELCSAERGSIILRQYYGSIILWKVVNMIELPLQMSWIMSRPDNHRTTLIVQIQDDSDIKSYFFVGRSSPFLYAKRELISCARY